MLVHIAFKQVEGGFGIFSLKGLCGMKRNLKVQIMPVVLCEGGEINQYVPHISERKKKKKEEEEEGGEGMLGREGQVSAGGWTQGAAHDLPIVIEHGFVDASLPIFLFQLLFALAIVPTFLVLLAVAKGEQRKGKDGLEECIPISTFFSPCSRLHDGLVPKMRAPLRYKPGISAVVAGTLSHHHLIFSGLWSLSNT
jgi:hypothetical protein